MSKKIQVTINRAMNPAPNDAQRVKEAVVLILENKQSSLSFEQLFSMVYRLSLSNRITQTFREVQGLLEGHMQKVVLPRVLGGKNLLVVLRDVFEEHRTHSQTLMYVLNYPARSLRDIPDVNALQMEIFSRFVLCHRDVAPQLTAKLVAITEQARDGRVDEDEARLLRDNCQMLWVVDPEHHLYSKLFEEPYLASLDAFLHAHAAECIAHMPCPDCLADFDALVRSETERMAAALGCRHTADKVRALMLDRLVEQRRRDICAMDNHGLPEMLRSLEYATLRLMFKLFGQTPHGHECLCAGLQQYIVATGQATIAHLQSLASTQFHREQCVELVRALLRLRTDMLSVLQVSFESSAAFAAAIAAAVRVLANDKNVPVARFVSLYIDDVLASHAGASQAPDVEEQINGALELFRALDDKYMFEQFYKRHLMDRLLNATAQSDVDAEKALLVKLRDIQGSDYIAEMKRMIEEVDKAGVARKEYADWLRDTAAPRQPFDLEMTVLPSGLWPVACPTSQPALPATVRGAYEMFARNYYAAKYPKMRLHLLPTFGSATIRARLGRTVVQLSTQTVQMLVLVLFNEKRRLSFEAVVNELRLDERCAAAAITALARLKIIRRASTPGSDRSRTLQRSDVLFVNPEYKGHSTKVVCYRARQSDERIYTPQMADEIKAGRIEVLKAAIVRALKARRTLSYNDIVSQVFQQLRHHFRPTTEAVKQAIEVLIDKEFIERDEEDRTKYHYIA